MAAFGQGLNETGFVDGQNVDNRLSLGRRAVLTGCRSWLPIWSIAKSQ